MIEKVQRKSHLSAVCAGRPSTHLVNALSGMAHTGCLSEVFCLMFCSLHLKASSHRRPFAAPPVAPQTTCGVVVMMSFIAIGLKTKKE